MSNRYICVGTKLGLWEVKLTKLFSSVSKLQGCKETVKCVIYILFHWCVLDFVF